MVKNAVKLYYPIKEAIASILPIVDEFVVALGDCDPDDNTLKEIESLNSEKIKIIHTIWDIKKYPNGMENAHQTDIAREACTGDWLFYLQADEVVHEKYLETIRDACKKHLDNKEVDGFLFRYKHFFGDYNHYIPHHGWYQKEIRIIRNVKDIHSWESAQSFRKIPDFDGLSYRKKEGTIKLKVVLIDAYVFHYGWVRPPELMQKKSKALDTIHKGESVAGEQYSKKKDYFDFGALGCLYEYKETHPAVMAEMISRFNWQDKLIFSKKYTPERDLMKHERTKYKVLTFIEQNILGGKQIFGYSNWTRINPK